MSVRPAPSSHSLSSLNDACARLLTVGFEGTELNDPLKALLDARVGGVILFRRNIVSKLQAVELIGTIREYAPQAVYIGVDQEGGLVQRFREGFTRFPSMRILGRTSSKELAYRLGGALGAELRAVGVDVNFAPVLDVDTNPANPVIGSRSLGRDASLVAALGVAVGQGIEAAGVASCGKHFPGHGDTAQDSHLELPRLTHPRSRLDQVELVPFAAWAKARLASLMTAHVVFESVDTLLPATMCPAVITGILREQLGFEGVVFSDDLQMRAIVDHFGAEYAGEASIRAGVDNCLVCRSPELALSLIERLETLSVADEAFASTIARANARMQRFIDRWTQPESATLFAPSGEEVVAEILQNDREQGIEQEVDPTEAFPAVLPPSPPQRRG